MTTTPPTAHGLAGYDLGSWLGLPLGTRIRLAASAYLGWPYRSGSVPAVAFSSPGVADKLVGQPATGVDCSTMTTSILTAVYPRAGWTQQDYADLQIFDAARRDSPMGAVVRRGVGLRVDDFAAGDWYLVQGWRKSGGGHAFLVFAGTDSILKLESTSRKYTQTGTPIGPRWLPTTADALRKDYDAALYLAVLS